MKVFHSVKKLKGERFWSEVNELETEALMVSSSTKKFMFTYAKEESDQQRIYQGYAQLRRRVTSPVGSFSYAPEDRGELERALDDSAGTDSTVRSCCEKRFEKKKLQKTLKLSDCRESIRKQIRPSCREFFRRRFE